MPVEMIVDTMAVGPIQANCHIAGCSVTKKAAIIDPGDEPERIIERVREMGVEPAWIIDTHGHGDHIGANGKLKEMFPSARLAVHELDAVMLPDARLNLSLALGMAVRSPQAEVLLKDDDTVDVGQLQFHVIHIPGHTLGSMALYLPADDGRKPALFVGDTLFADGVGRGDFPGGDFNRLIQSIRERLLTLPDETVVYPGHGGRTTIGREKRHNPFLLPFQEAEL